MAAQGSIDAIKGHSCTLNGIWPNKICFFLQGGNNGMIGNEAWNRFQFLEFSVILLTNWNEGYKAIYQNILQTIFGWNVFIIIKKSHI